MSAHIDAAAICRTFFIQASQFHQNPCERIKKCRNPDINSTMSVAGRSHLIIELLTFGSSQFLDAERPQQPTNLSIKLAFDESFMRAQQGL